jgi:hypothetical protein
VCRPGKFRFIPVKHKTGVSLRQENGKPRFIAISRLLRAFQAYDEGSIPFTRSNKVKQLNRNHLPSAGLGRSWEDPEAESEGRH